MLFIKPLFLQPTRQMLGNLGIIQILHHKMGVAVAAASESAVKNADFFILIVLVFDWIRDIIAEAIGMLI